MRYLTVSEVLDIYSCVMQQTGGLVAVRDIGALESNEARSHSVKAARAHQSKNVK